VAVASEMQEDLQAQLQGISRDAAEVVVVVALGNMDRFLQMEQVYDSYLEATVRMFQNENAKVMVMQTVPVDDIEHSIAKMTGARYLPAPKSAVEQFGHDPTLLPFVPHPPVHRDIANLILHALEQEMDLHLTGSAAASSEEQPRLRRKKHSGHGEGGPHLDGVWKSQENPTMLAMIQGDTILSPEGDVITRFRNTAPDTYTTELGDAQFVDGRLIWSDGDIWVRADEGGPELKLQKPPERKKKGDLKALKKAWDAAEEAVNRTRVEEHKRELHEERELLVHERHRLEQRRRAYEEGRRHQHEETEKLSALRAG